MSRIAPLAQFLLLVLLATAADAQDSQDAPGTDDVVTPTGGVLHLSNGRDLAGWVTWVKETGHDDPHGVFSVADDGSIHVSGEGTGYLATEKSYADYHLSLEYRWGERTNGSKYVRNSGVLLHGVGPHGGRNGAFMTSIECQLAQGCEGDLIVIRGNDERGEPIPVTITCNTRLASDGRTRWDPDGEKTVYSGKQFWWSKHEPGFAELLDTRGRDDVASPTGEWTRVDVTARGDRLSIRINGVTVNECYDVFPRAGRILLQNEGHEVYFRNVELRPLPSEGDGP